MRDDAETRDASGERSTRRLRRAPDLDEDAEPVQRGRRRGSLLPQSKWGRIAAAGSLLIVMGAISAGAWTVRQSLMHDARFAVDSSESIEIRGNAHATRAQLLSVFGEDLERNVFFVPLAERRAELERLPWVKHATVMRLLPGRLRIDVQERTPVAFVREGKTIELVDAGGVLLDMPAAEHYSFPVVTGISARDSASMRAARMKIYMDFIKQMDASGEKISESLSEVDLSSPEDVKAVPEKPGSVMVHFGDADYLNRYNKFEQHLAEWTTQYPKLASVDMRYDRQVVLEMQPGSDGVSASSAPVSGSTELASALTAPKLTAAAKPAAPGAATASAETHVRESGHGAPGLAAPKGLAGTVNASAKAAAPAPARVAAAKAAPAKAANSAAKTKAHRVAATKAMLARGRVLKEQQTRAVAN